MKKKVNTVLTKLDKENYLKFKEYNSYIQKKQFKFFNFNIK